MGLGLQTGFIWSQELCDALGDKCFVLKIKFFSACSKMTITFCVNVSIKCRKDVSDVEGILRIANPFSFFIIYLGRLCALISYVCPMLSKKKCFWIGQDEQRPV